MSSIPTDLRGRPRQSETQYADGAYACDGCGKKIPRGSSRLVRGWDEDTVLHFHEACLEKRGKA
jgi:hypothetical protein